MQPRTTFVNGINPFKYPEENMKTVSKPSIPAKPKKSKTKIVDDYSTPYAPPPPPIAQATGADHVAEVSETISQPTLPDYLLDMGISITDDPLPSGRIMAPGSRKYDPLFKSLAYGQSIKVPTEHVGKIAGALRKFLVVYKKTGIVRTVKAYPSDGIGRVWLLETNK